MSDQTIKPTDKDPMTHIKNPSADSFDIPEEETIEVKETKQMEEQKKLDEMAYDDDDHQTQDSEAVYEELLRQTQDTIDSDNFRSLNMDKMGQSIPLSDYEELDKYRAKELLVNRANLEQIIADATSDVRIIDAATRCLTSNLNLLIKSLGQVENLSSLQPTVRNLRDSMASVFKKFDGDRISLSGADGHMALTTLMGGIRRIRLYNSGFFINLRNLSLTHLNNYYREANTTDFEYGRTFGAYYFMFSDLAITKYIVKHLFPLMICGSSYRNWKDEDQLLRALSFQDFQTILWAAATMMHPDGVTVNFTCGEPGCGHITKEFIDLSKLRLLNTDLINDEMFAILSKKGVIDDKDLQEYHERSGLNRTIEFEYKEGDGTHSKKWKLHLKQASLYDYIQTGEDYLNLLEQECNLKKREEVQTQTLYNHYRVFKPWIASAEVTVFNHTYNKEQTYVFENDGSDEMDAAMNDMLDQFQDRMPGTFGDMMTDYIISTKITHICFYFPKCPKCGATPKMSHNGYIPYDVMQGFFTLVLMKLLQASSTHDTKNTSSNEDKH